MLEELREHQMYEEQEIRKKIERIALEYGYEPQSRQLIEEMAELTQAINKAWRVKLHGGHNAEVQSEGGGRTLETIADMQRQIRGGLLEEIADVQIMLWQIAFLIQHDNESEKSPEEVLAPIIQEKLNRQIDRINMRHEQAGESAELEKEREYKKLIESVHDWICKYGTPKTFVTVSQYAAQVWEGVDHKQLQVPD